MLAVWLEHEPLPAVTPFWNQLGDIEGRGFAVQGLLILWAFALVVVYALNWVNRPGPAWWKGATFGLAMWAVLFIFFEAYVPFNLLGEPFQLVLIELSLHPVAMMLTGSAIALLYRPISDGAQEWGTQPRAKIDSGYQISAQISAGTRPRKDPLHDRTDRRATSTAWRSRRSDVVAALVPIPHLNIRQPCVFAGT